MPRFIQLHFLTHYPVSNPNRDDMGEPKEAIIGGTPRMRISSQCLKRTWRLSDVYQATVEGRLGTRTRNLGKDTFEKLKTLLEANGVPAEEAARQATDHAIKIASCFAALKADKGKTKGKTEGEDKANDDAGDAVTEEPKIKEEKGKGGKVGKGGKANEPKKLWAEQIVFISPSELDGIQQMCVRISQGFQPSEKELNALVEKCGGYSAADIAGFGRMMVSAKDPRAARTDGAFQVAHAFSVTKAETQDDYFSAVDDWQDKSEDGTGSGSAHNSVQRFASGLLYHYVCVDVDLLIRNQGGNVDLAQRNVKGLIEAALTVTPSGKKNSHGQNQMANYALVEVGDAQPFSYADVFNTALPSQARIADAISKIQEAKGKREKVLPTRLRPSESSEYSLEAGTGSFDDLLSVATKAVN